jgi:Putative Ig domain
MMRNMLWGEMMPVSGKSAILLCLLGVFGGPYLLFGQGTITSVSGGSPAGPVTGITNGTDISGFTLTLNGAFHTSSQQNRIYAVRWLNPAQQQDQSFNADGQLLSISSTQITLNIPSNLFNFDVPVTSQQTVQIIEYEYDSTGQNLLPSNTATFYINPQPGPINPSLPDGTVSIPYTSTPLESGGTGPFTTALLDYGPLPPGTKIQNTSDNTSFLVVGTPTTAGGYYFALTVTDAWGNIDDYSFHSITIYPLPVISPPLAPSGVGTGSSYVALSINGQGFVTPIYGEGYAPGSDVTWSAGGATVDLASYVTVVSPTLIQVYIPSNLLTTPVTALIRVVQPNGTASNAVPFLVSQPVVLSVNPASVPVGSPAFTLTINGAYFSYVPDNQLSASAPGAQARVIAAPAPRVQAPQVMFGNTALATTFVNSNTLTATIPAALVAAAGTYQISVINPGGVSSAPFGLTVFVPIPPLQISGGSLPNGTVGVPYSAGISASGGTPGYTFSAAGGSVPPGLAVSPDGTLTGTPTQAGQYRLTVQVTDSKGVSTSAAYSVTIVPPPIVLSGTLGDLVLGAAVNAKFSATGGVPPYVFSASGALPSGTTFSNATITGVTNSVGTFLFTIAVTDSANTTVTKTFTVKVTVGPVTVAGTLADGQVSVPYTGQVTATGGQPPYKFSVTGLPAGVSLGANGQISGIPATVGTYTVGVTATDSAGATGSQSFTVNITAAPLAVSTSALGDGFLGVAYSSSVAATGGVPPYTWTFGGLPDGVAGSSGGVLSGAPTKLGAFQVTASVADSKGGKASRQFTVNITNAPLSVSGSLPNGVVGTPVSGSVSATGGAPPYQFSASGLPSGVSMSSAGALSGSPAAAGTFSVTVAVKDSTGAGANKSLSMTVTLPSPPGSNFGNLPNSSSPGTQAQVPVTLSNTYPVDVTVDLTLTFAPDSGPDDPAVQFSTGGRTARQIIPAGSATSPTQIGVQTGTVAGLITITAHLTAAGQDISGTPVPTRTIRVNATAPVITSVTATRNSTGFTVTVVGFASSREMTQALFQFTAASGTTLSSSSLTVPIDTIFSGWYQSPASSPFGSQFTYTQPFTVSGGAQSIVSVSVTLVNKVGSSTAVSANLQ